MKLPWRSQVFSNLVRDIDKDILITSRIGKAKKRTVNVIRHEAVNEEEDCRIPEKLSKQVFDSNWVNALSLSNIRDLKICDVVLWDDNFNLYRGQ